MNLVVIPYVNSFLVFIFWLLWFSCFLKTMLNAYHLYKCIDKTGHFKSQMKMNYQVKI